MAKLKYSGSRCANHKLLNEENIFKTMKYTVFTLILFFSFHLGISQTLKVVTKEGQELQLDYTKQQVKNSGIEGKKRHLLKYSDISYIGTDNIDAYERVMRKAGKKENEHLNIDFTGDGSAYAARLQKLQENRAKANIASGAGGLLMLIGSISGDRDVYDAGRITLAAGVVAGAVNSQRTLETQNNAIIANQNKTKKDSHTANEEQQLRQEFGDENVEAILELIDRNYERAIAFANVAETSKDANHRVAASWVKAIIYADSGQKEQLQKEYEKLVILDSEISSVENAEKWMVIFSQDLGELRNG